MRVILNADDLGYTPAVNQTILALHDAGCLTSASLVVNLPHSAAAIQMRLIIRLFSPLQPVFARLVSL